MKILSIGYNITKDGVTNSSETHNLPSLYDFEAVIINPYVLKRSADVIAPWNLHNVGPSAFESRASVIKKLRTEAKLLLEKGGIIVCLVTPVYSYSCDSFVPTRYVTNYHWMPFPYGEFSDLLKEGKGTEVNIKKISNAFQPYLKMKGIEWNAFFDDLKKLEPKMCISNMEGKDSFFIDILAENSINKPIAISVVIGKGVVLFLPVLSHEKSVEILLSCLNTFANKKTGRTPPSWIMNYPMPKEKELRDSLKGYESKILELQNKREDIQKQIDELSSLSKLLYEQNEILEDTVRDAFTELGFKMIKKEDKDWIASADEKEGIVEVTGTEGAIDITKLRQLLQYILSEESTTGIHKKPILVGNHYINEPPESRKEPFTEKTLKEAELHSICLLPCSELYNAICMVREGKLDVKAVRSKILSTTGLCRI